MEKKAIQKHPTIIYASDIIEVCKPLEALGINYFSCVRIYDNGSSNFIINQPAFVELYLENDYFKIDGHILHQNCYTENFYLMDFLKPSMENTALRKTVLEFNIGSGILLVEKFKGYCQLYIFCADLCKQGMNQFYINNVNLLEKFILYFKTQLQEHKTLSKQFAAPCLLLMRDDFKNEEIFFASDADKHKFLERITLDRYCLGEAYHHEFITRRELECLQYTTLGKTAAEIGMILDLSKRSVEAYLDSVKQKLNCYSKLQLGRIANKLSLID